MIDFFLYNNRIVKPVEIPPGYSNMEIRGWSVYFPKVHSTVIANEFESYNIIIGDLINQQDLPGNVKKSDIINLQGHFYLLNIAGSSLKIFSGFLNILPIFYNTARTIFSSNVNIMNRLFGVQDEIDKSFILENTLFNYSFSDRTLYRNISLVPANHYVSLNETTVSIDRHFNTLQLFSTQGYSYSLDTIAELFIKRAQVYFPKEKHAITFTGGFDGRTLTALGQFFNLPFITTSLGAPGNDDLELPEIQSRQIGIEHKGYNLLARDYLTTGFSKHAANLIDRSPGYNGYLYPHFSYLAEEISKQQIQYLLTGYFGSELFRALHIGGALTSEVLYQYFLLDKARFKNFVKLSGRLQFIGFNYEDELDALLNEVDTYFSNLPGDLTKNQKFYYFVFEEVFRKMFGTWINAQMQFLKIRTPFLDYLFVSELLKSKFAGSNNDFATKNPFKRMKGQQVYSKVIQKTGSALFNMNTQKGYSPQSIVKANHSFEILAPYFKKKFLKKGQQQDIDNLGLISGVANSFNDLNNLSIPHIFNNQHFMAKVKTVSPYMNELDRDMILYVLSNLKK